MTIHQIRNATIIIESEDNFILVDPLLGKSKTFVPLTLFRFKPRRNPLVDLPIESEKLLQKIDYCLITHLHPDHIDAVGIEFLRSRKIPVLCGENHARQLKKWGLNVLQAIDYWETISFLKGKLTSTPAVHGYGWVRKPMGHVYGFVWQSSDDESVYISADTIYTDDVKKVLAIYKPDVSVLACGSAQFDFGRPLLMTMDDIVKFICDAPGKVLANHMEAINHCPTTRLELKQRLEKEGLLHKTFIPADGERIEVVKPLHESKI